MTFAREVLEIVTDTEDSERFDRMSDVLESTDLEALADITTYLERTFHDLRPPMPTFLHAEYHAAMAAAFTYGVLIGREHRRRGYPDPV